MDIGNVGGVGGVGDEYCNMNGVELVQRSN